MSKEPHVPYNFRIPKKLKSRLEKEARDKKRSLNQEMVYRLETSLEIGQKEMAMAS